MSFFTLFMTYVVTWWMVLFVTLPFGSAPPEQVEDGHSSGAPAKTHLGKKLLATTVISVFVTWGFFALTDGFLVAP